VKNHVGAGPPPSLRGSPRNKSVACDEKSQRVVCGFGNADARRDLDTLRTKPIIRNEQISLLAGQVLFVVALPSDAEGFGETSGAAGQLSQVRRVIQFDVSRERHLLDSGNWFECAEQNSAGLSIGQAGDVEAIMIAIDEINVREAWRSEEDEVTQSASAGRVRSRIIQSEVGFDFHNSGGQQLSLLSPHQDLA
jgi:hypothetical protein